MKTTQVIASVNEKFSIVRELRKRSFLKKEGSLFYGRCPWCGMYGLAISEPQNIYYCFSCKEGGNTASYIMQRDNLLIKELAMLIENDTSEYQKALIQGKRIISVLSFAQEFYSECAKDNEFTEYMISRGVTERTMKEWGIGAATDTTAFFKAAYLKGFEHNDLIDAGLMTTYGDAVFRRRVMFPLRDERGFTIGFTGRALGDVQPKYLNSPSSPLYQKSTFLYGIDKAIDHIKKHNTIVLVEGQMDAIALHQNGIQFAVGVSGTAFTQEHVKVISRLIPGGNIILMFDGDTAGQKATLRAGEMLEGRFELSVSSSTLGKDASDHFKEGGKVQDFTTTTYQDFKSGLQIISTSDEIQFSADHPEKTQSSAS